MSDWIKNSKRKLEQREIRPSNGAWEKLESLLDEEQKTHTQKKYTFWAVAAGLFLVIGMSYLFVNQTDKKEDKKLTAQPSTLVLPENKQKKSPEKETIKTAVAAPKTIKTQEKEVPQKQRIKKETSTKVCPEEEKKIAVETQEKPIETKRPLGTKEEISVENNPNPVEPEQKTEIKNNYKITAKVKAKNLLNSVENEIFEKKSERFLDKVSTQLKNWQLALADRNIEK